ncbi:MAG: phenylacetic acid degradation protein [Pseudomonadota bacterium]
MLFALAAQIAAAPMRRPKTAPPAPPPFARLLGVTLRAAGDGRRVGAITVRPEFCAEDGALQGGAAMALADAVAAVGGATVQSSVSFAARPRPGERLTAQATPAKIGPVLSIWETRITGADGALIALVSQTKLSTEA